MQLLPLVGPPMTVVVTGNPKPMSRTRAAAELTAERLTDNLPLEDVLFELVPAVNRKIVILEIVTGAMHPDVIPMVFHRSRYLELEPTG
jgi:hypothetical protein